MLIDVIIPAFNEESAIVLVLNDIPKELVREIIVVDNNSTDETAAKAALAGATVLTEKKQGYGAACLRGIEYLSLKNDKPDIVLFLDADYSDHPEEMEQLILPIMNGEADLVIGSRVKEKRENGAMLPQQIIGNWIATILIRFLYRFTYHDLGPFRAIRYDKLMELKMKDQTFGWTVEMQVKALNHKLKIKQIAVSYRKRKGVSKISGTLKGTVSAGVKIINTIVKYH
jgi:glycosyltransferase involved in cell wall biosynthesis